MNERQRAFSDLLAAMRVVARNANDWNWIDRIEAFVRADSAVVPAETPTPKLTLEQRIHGAWSAFGPDPSIPPTPVQPGPCNCGQQGPGGEPYCHGYRTCSCACHAAPAVPLQSAPACLRTLTPEEMASFQPLSSEAIAAALEAGARDKALAMGRPWLVPHEAEPPAVPLQEGTTPACVEGPNEHVMLQGPPLLAACGHTAYRDHRDMCIQDGCEHAAYQVVNPVQR